MKKRIEIRLGEYRLIGKLAEDGAVTVLVEHALEGQIEAEVTLGGDGRSDESAISPQRAEALRRNVLGIDEGEGVSSELAPTTAPASRVQAQPQEPGFPPRPGMTRSRVEPSDD